MSRFLEGGNHGLDISPISEAKSYVGVTVSELLNRQFSKPESSILSKSPLHILQVTRDEQVDTMVIVDHGITGDGLVRLYFENASVQSDGHTRSDILDDHQSLEKNKARYQRHLSLPGFSEYEKYRMFFKNHIEQSSTSEQLEVYGFLHWKNVVGSSRERVWVNSSEDDEISKLIAEVYKKKFADMKGLVDLRSVNPAVGANILACISPEYWDGIRAEFIHHGYIKNKKPEIGGFSKKMYPNSAAALPLVYIDELLAASHFPPAVEEFMAAQAA